MCANIWFAAQASIRISNQKELRETVSASMFVFSFYLGTYKLQIQEYTLPLEGVDHKTQERTSVDAALCYDKK